MRNEIQNLKAIWDNYPRPYFDINLPSLTVGNCKSVIALSEDGANGRIVQEEMKIVDMNNGYSKTKGVLFKLDKDPDNQGDKPKFQIKNPFMIHKKDNVNDSKPQKPEESICLKKVTIVKKCTVAIVKYPRKLLPDSLRKKIKTHFHQYIINYFNLLINVYYKYKKYVIQKITKEKTSRVDISYCSKLIPITMKELLSTTISIKCTTLPSDYNKGIIQKIEKHDFFIPFLNLTYEEIYNIYISSQDFQLHAKKLSKLYGTYYSKMFVLIAKDFINYYKTSKPYSKITALPCAS